ncbi:hypothetical protein AGMMS49928_10550 [Spirochaetia bacterium]|nr:hypothetical protein AGMMS49928_10550 [Spirochaetia bacterium]
MGKNKKRYPEGIVLVVLALALGGCLGPLKEAPMGYLQIGGAASGRTLLPGVDEVAIMTYKVHLSGPGGTIDQNFGPAGGTIDLAPGSWNITVKAYNDTPRLRGIAEETITVASGSSHTIALKTCIGVSTEADLSAALQGTLYPRDTADGDLIVLEKDITVVPSPGGFFDVQIVTIIADPGTIRTLTTAAFRADTGGRLTLGRQGETGGLVLDGNGLDYGDAITGYASYGFLNRLGGSLTINGNTEIKNYKNSSGNGGAITVLNGGYLTINGGDIHDNQNTEPSGSSYGGAIFVDGSTFVMTGGIIRDNSAIDRGGGIYCAGTSTNTIGAGVISGNSAGNGGGVYSSATNLDFNGTTISGNNAADITGIGGIYKDGGFTGNPLIGLDNVTFSGNMRNGVADINSHRFDYNADNDFGLIFEP